MTNHRNVTPTRSILPETRPPFKLIRAVNHAKRRGVKLGSHRPGLWNGREDSRQAGLAKAREVAAQFYRQAADDSYSDLVPMIRNLHGDGQSLQAIADELNEQGHTTRRGGGVESNAGFASLETSVLSKRLFGTQLVPSAEGSDEQAWAWWMSVWSIQSVFSLVGGWKSAKSVTALPVINTGERTSLRPATPRQFTLPNLFAD